MSALHAVVDEFLRYLKVERQLSPLTQENYARQLAALSEMAEEMKLERNQAGQTRANTENARAKAAPRSVRLRQSTSTSGVNARQTSVVRRYQVRMTSNDSTVRSRDSEGRGRGRPTGAGQRGES